MTDVDRGKYAKRISYSDSGVDVDASDAVKRRMARSIDSGDPRVLNRLGAFGSIVEARVPGIDDPVLVLKTEEPGSKQQIALQMGRVESLCADLINHLVNDIAVVGAHPQYVLDFIVSGELDALIVERLVAGMTSACRAVGAVLVGGETSVQPGVLPASTYVLSATAVGVAERTHVIDGAVIRPGDAVLAVNSNGLHTNGYTLVRQLLEAEPGLSSLPIDGETFLDAIMRPHTGYYGSLRDLFGDPGVHGLAHVTGGGIADNLRRVLPPSVNAWVDLGLLRVDNVFKIIRDRGMVLDSDMLRTFNLGCGLMVVCAPESAKGLAEHFAAYGLDCWEVGHIITGEGNVVCEGQIPW
jgi:phosphoribosylformylglycinamidine cyclo-ligase